MTIQNKTTISSHNKPINELLFCEYTWIIKMIRHSLIQKSNQFVNCWHSWVDGWVDHGRKTLRRRLMTTLHSGQTSSRAAHWPQHIVWPHGTNDVLMLSAAHNWHIKLSHICSRQSQRTPRLQDNKRSVTEQLMGWPHNESQFLVADDKRWC